MGVGRIQMNFIHLLSTEAVQHITIHCLNTAVWAAGPGLLPGSRAVSFRTWTGEKIQAGDLLEPLVVRDDCWVSSVVSQRFQQEVVFESFCSWLYRKMERCKLFNFSSTFKYLKYFGLIKGASHIFTHVSGPCTSLQFGK